MAAPDRGIETPAGRYRLVLDPDGYWSVVSPGGEMLSARAGWRDEAEDLALAHARSSGVP